MVKSMSVIDHPSGNSAKYHISFQPRLNSEDYKMNPIGGKIRHEITLSDIAGSNVCKHPFSGTVKSKPMVVCAFLAS